MALNDNDILRQEGGVTAKESNITTVFLALHVLKKRKPTKPNMTNLSCWGTISSRIKRS